MFDKLFKPRHYGKFDQFALTSKQINLKITESTQNFWPHKSAEPTAF